MEQKRSYYELLELEPSAAPDKVKAAYRRLARTYHPDVNPDNPQAEAKFKAIGEAYAVLSDPQKRAVYDQTLGVSKNSRTKTAKRPEPKASSGAKTSTVNPTKASQSKAPPRSKSSASTTAKPDPTVDMQGTRFREMFDSLFRKEERRSEDARKPEESAQQTSPKKQAASSTPPRRGEDVTVETFITRDEATQGVVKTVNVQHADPCKRCSGTGKINGTPCPVCHGEKQLVTLRKIDVRIPPGVKGGAKVRVAREGGRGSSGGEPGDLFLLIRIQEEQGLKVDGLTVTCEIPITMPEAVLGAEVDVPTLHGKVRMTIPPQTSSGAVFRLRGQGVSVNGSTGDQMVTVMIVSPKTLSSRERELYEELARLQKDSPRR